MFYEFLVSLTDNHAHLVHIFSKCCDNKCIFDCDRSKFVTNACALWMVGLDGCMDDRWGKFYNLRPFQQCLSPFRMMEG